MTMALIYRTLERNTGSVGLASVPCESIQAVNPEIAALQQHQDPASDGAQALNKEIASELARQIASIGGDPLMANEASTFAPGEIGDPTGAGNTCDDANDDAGCINSQNLRVDDLTEDEIAAAVAGVSGGVSNGTAVAGNGTENAAGNSNNNNNNNNANTGNNNDCNNVDVGNNNNDVAAGDAAADENAASANGASTFGNCDPTITFGIPSDGRKEEAFEPTDLSTFNHGSAQKIDIISQFICSQMSNKCDVDAAAVSTCDAAASAASGLTGQAAADAFNSALGL
jgi:hypothetical protein